jgi:Leucine-rich repeat (LRR) protein
MHGNKLKTVPRGMFALTRLTKVNLSNNHISEFAQGEVEAKIEDLTLAKNALEELPGSFFASPAVQSALTKLNVGNNELTSLPEEIGECTLLEELVLQKNELQQLPASFAGLTNLKKLVLSDNNTITVPRAVIEALPATCSIAHDGLSVDGAAVAADADTAAKVLAALPKA